MEENQKDYTEAVRMIKEAILNSQYEAGKLINGHQLMLYYRIGKYISANSRKGFWGKGAIDLISHRLDKELPGLRGFSARNLRYMRTFYEEWAYLDQDNLIGTEQVDKMELASAKVQNINEISIWNLQVPKELNFPMEEFLSIGFTHHWIILSKVKDKYARLFYIQRCYDEKFNVESLSKAIIQDDYHHQGSLPNNFLQTLPASEQAFRAISTFKDEYLLDYINVEEIGIRDREDMDEKVVENAIVHNIKNFILTFGKDFTFVRNQYHLDAFGEDQFIDILFFNRALNCLVAVELKKGKFKTAYLGQLSGYLSILDEFEKKPHENPSIGIILCKDMNKAFADFVIRDYSKPMGVATYKTSADMSEELKKALPDIEELKKMLENEDK